jgi:hypothetical protein
MNEVKGISTRIMGRKRTTSNVENNDPDALSVLNQAKQLGVESGKKPKLEHTAVHFGSNRQVQQPKGDRISFEGKALSFKLPSKPSKPSLSRVPSGLPRINPPNDPSLEIIR